LTHLGRGTDIALFVGRFGSGKTETAINYALSSVNDQQPNPDAPAGHLTPRIDGRAIKKVLLIDLDVVTPYFRSRETADRMRSRGVEVIAPSIVGQHLDTPAITPQIQGAIQQETHPVVLDVGGDRQGARALGQFSAAIRQRGYAMYFVVNPYRPYTNTLKGLSDSLSEIEASARLRATSLVSNPNMMAETTSRQILDGHTQIEAYARELRLPIAFVCLERRWAARMDCSLFAQPVLFLDRHFVMSWE
jgi:hypothetical protein